MHANPFTKGHRYLIEQAGKRCDELLVLVLATDGSRFSFSRRLAMVQAATADLDNVRVLDAGPFSISALTFPTYF